MDKDLKVLPALGVLPVLQVRDSKETKGVKEQRVNVVLLVVLVRPLLQADRVGTDPAAPQDRKARWGSWEPEDQLA